MLQLLLLKEKIKLIGLNTFTTLLNQSNFSNEIKNYVWNMLTAEKQWNIDETLLEKVLLYVSEIDNKNKLDNLLLFINKYISQHITFDYLYSIISKNLNQSGTFVSYIMDNLSIDYSIDMYTNTIIITNVWYKLNDNKKIHLHSINSTSFKVTIYKNSYVCYFENNTSIECLLDEIQRIKCSIKKSDDMMKIMSDGMQ